MGDSIYNFRSLTIEGLAAGEYLVTAYAAGHAGEPYPQRIRAHRDPLTDAPLAGRYGLDRLVAGQTHTTLSVRPIAGVIVLQALDSDPFLNALQIQLVPEPTLAWSGLTCLLLLRRSTKSHAR